MAIDVNTGKFVGKSNRLEDTIVKTNTDAIKEIVRQIRLRDLGGIIVVDFIDMDERKNRQKVMQVLEEAMRADRAPYKILQFNDFGLVAITRKRVKQSLERTLCSPCPYCEAAGYVKSVGTVIGEILQEAHKIAQAVEGSDVMLRVNPEVAKVLKSNQNTFLQEIEEILGRTVHGEERSAAAPGEVRPGVKPNRYNWRIILGDLYGKLRPPRDSRSSTDWVSQHAGDPEVRIVEVDVDTKAYDEGHVPGAIAWAWNTQLCDTVRRDILSKEQFEQLMSRRACPRTPPS